MTSALFGPDGTQLPEPATVLPDPLVSPSVTGGWADPPLSTPPIPPLTLPPAPDLAALRQVVADVLDGRGGPPTPPDGFPAATAFPTPTSWVTADATSTQPQWGPQLEPPAAEPVPPAPYVPLPTNPGPPPSTRRAGTRQTAVRQTRPRPPVQHRMSVPRPPAVVPPNTRQVRPQPPVRTQPDRRPPPPVMPGQPVRHQPPRRPQHQPPQEEPDNPLIQTGRKKSGGGWVGCLVVLIFFVGFGFNLIESLISLVTDLLR